MPVTTKSRKLGFFRSADIITPFNHNEVTPGVSGQTGIQYTVSEGHPWHVKPRPQGDLGGEFTTVKVQLEKGSTTEVYSNLGAGPWYGNTIAGTVFPFSDARQRLFDLQVVPDDSFNSGVSFRNADLWYPDLSTKDSKLFALGTEAIDRVKPTNSIASVAQALGELKRDGLPSLYGTSMWRERTNIARGAGSEYLNHVFGWAPLVSDIKKFAQAATQSSKILKQLERDSGRQVRRRYDFPSEVRTEVIEDGVQDYPYPDIFNRRNGAEQGRRVTTRRIERKMWFSGAFTYYIPGGDSVYSRIARGYQEFDKLYGGVLDPEIIWNLTPWSWATDWAFNTGSVISNLTDASVYGLVMPYGYMMEQTSVTYNYRMLGLDYWGAGAAIPTATVTHTVKKRRKASPFGFGVTWDGLNSSQLAIVAALGLTRDPHRAH